MLKIVSKLRLRKMSMSSSSGRSSIAECRKAVVGNLEALTVNPETPQQPWEAGRLDKTKQPEGEAEVEEIKNTLPACMSNPKH